MKIYELGHVVLYVSDLERLASFYRDVLGFHEIARIARQAALFSGGRTHHELLLLEVGGKPEAKADRTRPGLYHIGFKIGDKPETIKEAYHELVQKNVPIVGTADHGVTHSIYILDPDGNELELYADVSDVWKKNPTAIISEVKPLSVS